jgi:hypothetical protein
LVTAEAAFEPAVTPVWTMLLTAAPTNSACAITGRDFLLAVLAVGRLALRLALVFARLALREADARARVPAAFFAVVLRFVAAVRRLVVCVVAMFSAYPAHNVANMRSSPDEHGVFVGTNAVRSVKPDTRVMGERRFRARRWVQQRYARLLTAATLPLVAEQLSHPLVPVAHRPSPRDARRLVRKVCRISRNVASATHPLEQLAMVQTLDATKNPAIENFFVRPPVDIV